MNQRMNVQVGKGVLNVAIELGIGPAIGSGVGVVKVFAGLRADISKCRHNARLPTAECSANGQMARRFRAAWE